MEVVFCEGFRIGKVAGGNGWPSVGRGTSKDGAKEVESKVNGTGKGEEWKLTQAGEDVER